MSTRSGLHCEWLPCFLPFGLQYENLFRRKLLKTQCLMMYKFLATTFYAGMSLKR